MQLEDFSQYTRSCFNGEAASCSCACPFGMDVRGFAEKCANGRWNAAWKAYRTAAVFPAVVSALCPAPCKAHCQRADLGGAIDLPGLEAASIRFAKNKKADSFNIPPKDKKVAVVGAGPAGLSAALQLALKKYIVTVFEREESWGGSLRAHPRFPEFDEEFRFQFTAVKPGFLEFVYGREILGPEELADYEAVYLSTGKGGAVWEDGRFFAGGEAAGRSLIEGIAMGPAAAKAMEAFLMTGRREEIGDPRHENPCERYLPHPGVEAEAPGETETEEGAKAEAARCLQCDCSACMDGCEMLKKYRKKPHGIAREAFADSSAAPPIATQSIVRQTYSCTNCGLCREVCPEHADLGAVFMLSRTDRFSRNTGPKAFHDYWLRELDLAAGEASVCLPPPGKETCAYAFFPGCRLGMDAPEQVKAACRFLMEMKPGEVGLMLGCCGVPALWAGDLDRLEAVKTKIRQEWESLGKPTLVFACATCQRTFAEQMPEIPQVSLYALMAEAGLKPAKTAFPRAAVFDPCAARAFGEMKRAVRELAGRAGAELEELSGPSRCCGFGGHIQIPNRAVFEEIGENSAALSDKPYIVYCANCLEVFRERGKEAAHILDLYFPGGTEKTPAILEKHENALRLKQSLMKEIWNMDFAPERKPWDGLNLTLAEGLGEKLENCFISLEEVKETIWTAETTGDKLVSEDGWSLASLVKPVVTYWAQYRPCGGGAEDYEVATAYSHRIKWERTI